MLKLPGEHDPTIERLDDQIRWYVHSQQSSTRAAYSWELIVFPERSNGGLRWSTGAGARGGAGVVTVAIELVTGVVVNLEVDPDRPSRGVIE